MHIFHSQIALLSEHHLSLLKQGVDQEMLSDTIGAIYLSNIQHLTEAYRCFIATLAEADRTMREIRERNDLSLSSQWISGSPSCSLQSFIDQPLQVCPSGSNHERLTFPNCALPGVYLQV